MTRLAPKSGRVSHTPPPIPPAPPIATTVFPVRSNSVLESAIACVPSLNPGFVGAPVLVAHIPAHTNHAPDES